jgi:hypothetical protein
MEFLELDKTIIILMLIGGLIGIGLIGFGITGKVVFDNYSVKDLCESDSECKSPEVCCLFYQENAGVCHDASMCEKIKEITQRESITKDDWKDLVIQKPEGRSVNSELMFIGSLILVVVVALVYIYSSVKNKKAKGKKKTKSNIKKKKK